MQPTRSRRGVALEDIDKKPNEPPPAVAKKKRRE
jgi:hypothetical protein